MTIITLSGFYAEVNMPLSSPCQPVNFFNAIPLFQSRFQGDRKIKIRYFTDTDTSLIEFSTEHVVETREISGDLYIDLDEEGNLVSMTIEHAKDHANISEVSFLQMAKGAT